ncbi:ABC transporter permease [Actinoalloteichus caeruleus]|uniref:ABC transporter permease n=1 Tax=Actinoalloteichus cyanogriseus TaxID=2893586 RepID=UPI003AB01E89
MTTPTTQPEITARPPGFGAWMALVLAESKMVMRDTAGLLIPIGLPMLLLVMHGISMDNQVLPGTDGLTVMEVFVLPLVITMVVATVGVVNMPSFLSYYRRSGVLRRLAVTPMKPMMILVAQAVVSVIQSVIGIALALTLALAAFGGNLPRSPLVALGVFALTMFAMYAVGMLVAALAPTANSSVAIGLVLFFAMGATGGMFGSREALPDLMATIGEFLPFGAAAEALGAAWAGQSVDTTHILSLLGATLIGSLVAAKFFRWQ